MKLLEIPITLAQPWMGQPKKSNQKEKTLFSFLIFVFINKGDRKSHCVGRSELKELDINDLFERINTIKDMKSELIESTKKLQIMKIRRWLKRQILIKPSLQKPRLSTICILILKINKIHTHIKRQWTLILKIITYFKRKIKYIQLNKEKLQPEFLRKYYSFPEDFMKKIRIMKMKLLI